MSGTRLESGTSCRFRRHPKSAARVAAGSVPRRRRAVGRCSLGPWPPFCRVRRLPDELPCRDLRRKRPACAHPDVAFIMTAAVVITAGLEVPYIGVPAVYAPVSMSLIRVGPAGVQPRSSRVAVLVAARSMAKKVPIHPK